MTSYAIDLSHRLREYFVRSLKTIAVLLVLLTIPVVYFLFNYFDLNQISANTLEQMPLLRNLSVGELVYFQNKNQKNYTQIGYGVDFFNPGTVYIPQDSNPVFFTSDISSGWDLHWAGAPEQQFSFEKGPEELTSLRLSEGVWSGWLSVHGSGGKSSVPTAIRFEVQFGSGQRVPVDLLAFQENSSFRMVVHEESTWLWVDKGSLKIRVGSENSPVIEMDVPKANGVHLAWDPVTQRVSREMVKQTVLKWLTRGLYAPAEIAADVKAGVIEVSTTPHFEKRDLGPAKNPWLWIRPIGQNENIRAVGHGVRTPVVFLSPENQSKRYFFNEKPEVSLEWEANRLHWVDRGKGLQVFPSVQVSKRSDFAELIQPALVTSRAKPNGSWMHFRALLRDLEPGSYYWKLNSESNVQRFEVVQLTHLPAPTLIFPQDGSVYGQKKERATIKLRWKNVAEAQAYYLRIAKDPDFEKPVLQTWVHKNEWTGEVNASGMLYWRVGSVDRVQQESHVGSDSILGNFRQVPVGKIHLDTPIQQKKIIGAMQKNQIQLSWSTRGTFHHYRLEITLEPDSFQNELMQNTENHQIILEDLQNGVYYWRVLGLDEEGRPTAASDYSRLEVVRPN